MFPAFFLYNISVNFVCIMNMEGKVWPVNFIVAVNVVTLSV